LLLNDEHIMDSLPSLPGNHLFDHGLGGSFRGALPSMPSFAPGLASDAGAAPPEPPVPQREQEGATESPAVPPASETEDNQPDRIADANNDVSEGVTALDGEENKEEGDAQARAAVEIISWATSGAPMMVAPRE
jgi:hypothetical protein